MKRFIKIAAISFTFLALLGVGYAIVGYWDAIRHSNEYAQRADALIAEGYGPTSADVRQLMHMPQPQCYEP